MRVLWISGISPLPLTDGHRQRVYHLLRSVARNHATTLLCQVRASDEPHWNHLAGFCERFIPIVLPDGKEEGPLARLTRRIKSVATLSPTCFLPTALPSMQAELQKLRGEDYDLAIGGLYCAPLVLAAPARRKVLDDQNVEGDLYRQLWQSEPQLQRRVSRMLDWLSVDAFERRILPQADLVTVCSPRDRALLHQRIPSLPTTVVVPNGVDLTGSPSVLRVRTEEVLIFTGSMSYAPNVEAAVYLVRDIMPRVWQERPEVRLLLVGKDPHPRVARLASPRVVVTGAVPDVHRYLDRAALALAPLRSGGGTRLKILEAMAAGVPVVSTPAGAAGLDVEPGHQLAVAGEAAEFAATVLQLLSSPEKAAELARSALRRVQALYSWDTIGAGLVEALETCHTPAHAPLQRTIVAPR